MDLMLSVNQSAPSLRSNNKHRARKCVSPRPREIYQLCPVQLAPGRRSNAGTELRMSPWLTAAGVDDTEQVRTPSPDGKLKRCIVSVATCCGAILAPSAVREARGNGE